MNIIPKELLPYVSFSICIMRVPSNSNNNIKTEKEALLLWD